jgi:uncharacterized protein (TIGR00251 family)
MAPVYAKRPDGLLLRIRVTPRARRNAIDGTMIDAAGDSRLKIAVTVPPADGKANRAVIAMLAKEWRMPKSSFSIVAGASDRLKTICLSGDPDALAASLDRWCLDRNFAAA